MSEVVELKQPPTDAELVEHIRWTLATLCDGMNAAELRGIDVSFNIGRTDGDPKKPWIVATEKITKSL